MLIFAFLNPQASFHGDGCSFDACAKVKRERGLRGRCCIKLELSKSRCWQQAASSAHPAVGTEIRDA